MGLFSKKEQIEYIVEISDIKCGMCETHINNLIRKSFEIDSVKSNHRRGITVIKCQKIIDEIALKNAIESTGYKVGRISKIKTK